MKSWHADVWRNACGHLKATEAEDGARLVPIMDYCPSCQIGHASVPTSETENLEVADTPKSSKALQNHSKWGMCLMEWPAGESGGLLAPRSVWRIDVLATGISKAPLVRWPCTTYGYLQQTGATVATRADIAHWARLVASGQPPHFQLENVLDIGSNVGKAALLMSLFTTGRTIALEMLPDNFNVLNFFAQLNTHLGIDAVLNAVAPVKGKVKVKENGGRGFMVGFQQRTGIPAVEPMRFLEENYGEQFIRGIGFINLAVEGNEAMILHALLPIVHQSVPAIHVEWNLAHRSQCSKDGRFSAGSQQLLSEVDKMGYVAHDPYTGLKIGLTDRCQDFKDGPENLLLLPAVSLQRLGALASRWETGHGHPHQQAGHLG